MTKMSVTRKRTVALQYGVSLLVFLVALLLTQLLWPFIQPNPTPLFFAAIIAAFYGGFGPGLLISIISALAIDFFFFPPFGALDFTVPNLVRVGVFVIVSSLVSWLNETRKRLLDERERLLRQISGFNDELRDEVASATRELASANSSLFVSQQRLARSERLAVVGQMAASLAHEIGTPLHSISGHLELLAAAHTRHAETQRRVRVINHQVDYIVGTVKRLLEWTHKGKLALRPLPLNELLREVLWLVGPTLDKHDISVECDFAEDLPPLRADRDGLQQVFLNLINNSVDAMPGGGRIEVTTRLDGAAGLAEVVFRDSGVGIGPDAAEHLFEPMWTNKPTGSGFGLAIAHEVMSEHGGTIELVEGVGSGVAFRLTLPLGEPAAQAGYAEGVTSDVA
jgi:signal transduction histidine kinase